MLEELGDLDGAERWGPVLNVWLDTYQRGDGGVRRYRVTPVGKEADFESWLEDHLSVLKEFGYCVRLADEATDGIRGRQPMIDRRSVPDLLCRFTEDCERGQADDWLVIENKATAVGPAARHQLSRYVDLLPTRIPVEPAQVHGLLLADGADIDLRRGLEEAGLEYVSLSSPAIATTSAGASTSPATSTRTRLHPHPTSRTDGHLT